jgi:hypothetical protein
MQVQIEKSEVEREQEVAMDMFLDYMLRSETIPVKKVLKAKKKLYDKK